MHYTETKLRVQYYETDQMSVVHHSNYIRYYETARTELMRSLGASYSEMEEEGTVMPIISVNSRYILPIMYDELITIRAFVKELPSARITFYYEIYNEKGTLVNEGNTVLAFISKATQRPCRAPQRLVDCIKAVLSES